MRNSFINLLGQRFYRLEVIKYAGKDSHRNNIWICRCDCGKEKTVTTSNLLCGNTKSCGCWNTDRTRQMGRSNAIELGGAAFNAVYRRYKRHAHERDISFNLTKQQFYTISQKPCTYCGIPPSMQWGKQYYNGDFEYNGIDRVNSALGYNIDNCVASCRRCNQAKNDMSVDEFLAWIERVYKHNFG